MAQVFSCSNFFPYNAGYSTTTTASFVDTMFYAWKTFMTTQAGWTVAASGDGLSTFSLTGDVFTSAYKGVAGGLGNNSSWFILKEPSPGYAGTQRQFMIVKASSSDTYADYARFIFYSQQGFNISSATGNGHNSGANITATNPPCAYDEILFQSYQANTVGGNYIPSNFFNLNVATLSYQYSSNNAAHLWCANPTNQSPPLFYNFYASTTAPFSFYIFVSALDSAYNYKIVKMWAFDELTEYATGNNDPCVNTVIGSYSYGTSQFTWGYMQNAGGGLIQDIGFSYAWDMKSTFASKADAIAKTTTTFANNFVPARFMDRARTATAYTSYLSGADMAMPAIYMTIGGNPQYLGKSSLAVLVNQNKEQLQTVKVSSSKDHVVVSVNSASSDTPAVAFPWNGSAITY